MLVTCRVAEESLIKFIFPAYCVWTRYQFLHVGLASSLLYKVGGFISWSDICWINKGFCCVNMFQN